MIDHWFSFSIQYSKLYFWPLLGGDAPLTIHKPPFFLSLNASVYTFQTQVCTQNRLSSLSTLRSKKPGADTQVWMALHPPLPHLHSRSFLHNTQTPFLRSRLKWKLHLHFLSTWQIFFGSNPCAALLRWGGYSSPMSLCCKSPSGSEK